MDASLASSEERMDILRDQNPNPYEPYDLVDLRLGLPPRVTTKK